MPRIEEQHVSPEQVLAALETCFDPCCKERGVNIVELGLIHGVKVAENGQDVHVELLLTSGWCPFSTHLLQKMKNVKGQLVIFLKEATLGRIIQYGH